MPLTPISTAARLITTVMLGMLSIDTGVSQEPRLWMTLQDSVRVDRVVEGDTIPADWFSAAYLYEMVYDSICHTNYLFTECRKNGMPVNLRHWQDNRMVYADALLLTFNSRSEDLHVRPGDTVSFYRELRWYNPITGRQDTANYFALDTLEFIVHLVRASNGVPLAQLDSLGLFPRFVPGSPRVYGSRPIMALVTYVVPAAVGKKGADVFIGVTVRANGRGKYHFTRLDNVTVGASKRMRQAFYIAYLRAFAGIYEKRNVADLPRHPRQDGSDAHLSLHPVPNRDGCIRITFDAPAGGGSATVAIYDAAGELLFYPFDSRSEEGTITVAHRFMKSGVYHVALFHNDRIVKTTTIAIVR